MVENYQARYLVDFGLNPRELACLLTEDELRAYRLQDLLEQASSDLLDDETLFQTARANLVQFEVVGITERLPESARRIAALLGKAPVEFTERHNVASGQRIHERDLNPKTLFTISDMTRVDQALYRIARAHLEESLAL